MERGDRTRKRVLNREVKGEGSVGGRRWRKGRARGRLSMAGIVLVSPLVFTGLPDNYGSTSDLIEREEKVEDVG